MSAEGGDAGGLKIDVALARRLVSSQFPEWGRLSVREVETQGWDNRTFRLGHAMAVRLPSAGRYAAQAQKEAAWMPLLAASLPVTVPKVLAVGSPNGEFPWAWSVRTWIDGETAQAAQADSCRFAREVAAFLKALWTVDAADGPAPGTHCFWRGGPLATYDAEARAAFGALGDRIDAVCAVRLWDEALGATTDGPAVWVHGDVAPGNLLLRNGQLAAVIDWGCCAIGDPACDVAIAWAWFEREARATFVEALAPPEPLLARARGWALWKAAITAARTGPGGWPPKPVAERTLQALLSG